MTELKISVSTASLYPRKLSTCLNLLEKLPVENLELMPQDFQECSVDYIGPIFKRHPDLHVSSIHYPLILWGFFGNPYPAAQQTGDEITANLVQLAKHLGAETIVIHPLKEKGNFEPLKTTMLNKTLELLDLCTKEDIDVAIENSAHSLADNRDKMANYLSDLDHPRAVSAVDTTEAREVGIDPVVFLDNSLPVTHFHLSDHEKGKVHLPIGEGDINWSRIIEKIRTTGSVKKQDLVLEIAYKYLLKNPKTKLEDSIRRIDSEIN